MRCIIAEKPSVARAIAAELGRGASKNGYIECGSDVVTWCFGHILEMAMPEDYDPSLKAWRVEDLPILPSVWKLLPKDGAKEQLALIGRILKEADQVVNAGDPDREGQLLVDEVLEHFGYRGPVKRFWVSAQDSVSIQRGLAALKDNRDFRGFADAALARGRADWLIGMNLSRAYTLRASRGGARQVLTVGRVQTPTLALVVSRDREIAAFKPKPYQVLYAELQHANGPFRAKWAPEEGARGLDAEGRLIDPAEARALVAAVTGRVGSLEGYEQEPKSEGPPRVWSLTSLTAAASARWGYGADDVLKAAQELYEAKLTSYPRTDCEYLPESQHADAKEVLAAMRDRMPELGDLFRKADPSRKSKTWNDSKITAHHGIIPTQHRGDGEKLSRCAIDVYHLIYFAYLAQFFPHHEYQATKVLARVEGHAFQATGRVVTAMGWKEVFQTPEPEEESDDKEPNQALPAMRKGDRVDCAGVQVKDLKTKPPSRFTEGTLLKAMENIHKFVEDPEHKKLLKEGDGIGTPATRATILSELKRRTFLTTKGKAIISTELGQALVDALPEEVRSPVLTAVNERMLKEIEAGRTAVRSFLEGQEAFVRERVAQAADGAMQMTGAAGPECPICKQGFLRRIKGTKGFFWGCSRYKEDCKATFEDNRGKPVLGPKKVIVCPRCGQGELRQRTSAHGKFWGCNKYPDCKATFQDERGKPVLQAAAGRK